MKLSTDRVDTETNESRPLSNSPYANSTRLEWEVGGLSHRSISLFLMRNRIEAKKLFKEGAKRAELIGGVLSLYDSASEKHYLKSKKSLRPGKRKDRLAVKVSNIITLFYMDIHGVSIPVNYRVYDPRFCS